VESAVPARKSKAPKDRSATQPPPPAAADLRKAARLAERDRREAQACAKLAALPVHHDHAAGIDVGDLTHWVCVEATPDASETVREFPAHTPGLRQLVVRLQQCGVTTVALEASGVYGHVLFLTPVEAGFTVVMTSPSFTRQIKGRPKTDRRDCQWIPRLHEHGLLPAVFQPDDAPHTLRDYVRQRANLVRLSGQHIQRMQKALELMNLKLTKVLGDVTGVTGLKISRAIGGGERDPHELAKLRDRRCQHSQAEIAQALAGRYRPEYVTVVAQSGEGQRSEVGPKRGGQPATWKLRARQQSGSLTAGSLRGKFLGLESLASLFSGVWLTVAPH
jgi:hypothetical protein